MSYDIDVSIPLPEGETDDGDRFRTLSMNWLRNPFGLCSFAEDNVGDGQQSLWHVCNDNKYDTSNALDRPRFLEVVTAYHGRIVALEQGFFFFYGDSLAQFAMQYSVLRNPAIVLPVPSEEHTIVKIDVEHLADQHGFGFYRSIQYGECTSVLQYYKNWFAQLVELAKAMQDPAAVVYISN